MAKEWNNIPDHLAEFAMKQNVFFIASAVGDKDDINLSPKGVLQLRVLDDKTVLYADYNGSGNRTAEDLKAGGRATILFASFDEKPLILRFYCSGEVISKGTEEFNTLCDKHYPGLEKENFRQVFRFRAYRVQTSCGFGVPEMKFVSDRSDKSYFKELTTP